MNFHRKIILLALLAAGSTALEAQFSPVRFIHSDTLADNGYAWFLTDFDGDGDRDLLFSADLPTPPGSFEGTLLWLENDGTGHFGHAKVLQDIVYGNFWLADLNGDGLQDVLFRPGWAGLQWRPNLGGKLGNVVPIASDGPYNFVNTTDFDGDGDLDVVEHFRWIENGGLGFFAQIHTIDAGAVDLLLPDFETGDFDGDNLQDALFSILDTQADLAWLLLRRQRPNGSFAAPDTLDQQPNGYHAFSPHSLDLDSDGDLDVAAYYYDPAPGGHYQVLWYDNDGTGRFGTRRVLDVRNDQSPLAELLTDFDGDGLTDLLTSTFDTLSGNQKLGWLRNLGGGQFERKTTSLHGTGENLKFFDLTGDGQNDIISNNSAFLLTAGAGNGQFGETSSLFPHAAGATLLRSADPDNDGDPDLLFFSPFTANIGWWPNDGAGHFGQPKIVRRLREGFGDLLDCRGLDGDAVADFFFHTDTRAFVWRGTGGGQFEPEADTFPMFDPLFLEPVLTDADGDGDLDVLSNFTDSSIWFANDGQGAFGSLRAGVPAAFDGLSDCFGDLDGDGDVDLIVRRFNFYNGLYLQQSIFWKPQTSPGAYGPDQLVVHYPAPAYSWGGIPACARDMDGDGDLDLTPNGSYWYKNDGTGHGWAAQSLNGYLGPQAHPLHGFLALDFDGDSDTDNFTVYNYHNVPGNLLTLNANDGDGHFHDQRWHQYLPDQLAAIRIADVDFDRDGDPDVLLYRNGQAAWLENLAGEPPVQARCFLDENANGRRDSAETLLPGVALRLDPGGFLAFTDGLGLARFQVDTGAYNLGFVPDDCRVLSTDTSTFSVAVPAPGPPRWFGFLPDSTRQSMAVSMASGPVRCGFVVPFWVTVRNSGCIPAPATLALRLDARTVLVAASWSPSYEQGDSLAWETSPLAPGEQRTLALELQMPGPDHLGETLRQKAHCWPTTAPGRAEKSVFAAVLNCAYDPNDKSVNRPIVAPGYDPATSELIYTIRFQNTGTDTAFNVTLRDTLDPALDLATFRPLGGSHPFVPGLRSSDGAAVFHFENIALADSNVNERFSHGFVQFSIRLKSGLPVGTVVKNGAAIYFDFNPPVLTNVVETKIQVPTSTSAPGGLWAVRVSPNPNSGLFTVELSARAAPGVVLKINDPAGRALLEKQAVAGSQFQTIEAASLPEGLYFLQVVSETGRVLAVEKFVKQ